MKPSSNDMHRIWLCAANNADLYQSVFRSHGLPDRRNRAFWSSDAIAPRYYSNLTTLDADAIDEQLAEISRLKSLSRQFGFKDGFHKLDLGAEGFTLLFTAAWIWAEPDGAKSTLPNDWLRVTTPAQLYAWEQSWQRGGSPADERIFPPAILAEPSIAIYGRFAENRFDAGCIANRSSEVVGISNIFHLAGTPSPYADAISATRTFADTLPIVGYDRDQALAEMLRLGFTTLGKLRIWISEANG